MATEVSHETMGMPIVIDGDKSGIVLHMKANKVHDLDVVVITAGSFGASNDKTKTILKPLDIVTTAGANADVVKAIECCPAHSKRAQTMACSCAEGMPASYLYWWMRW